MCGERFSPVSLPPHTIFQPECFNSFWVSYEIDLTPNRELSLLSFVPLLMYGWCFVVVVVVFLLFFFTVGSVFVAAPYFFCPGRGKNCIVSAVTGRTLSQRTSVAVVSSTQQGSQS